MEVSRMMQENFKGESVFIQDTRLFQGRLKDEFNNISRKI